jgi:hypothetical protein
MVISGQNGTTAPTGTIPSGTGVYITGAGNNGPDVYLSSQNGESYISIDNTGVQIVSPQLSSGGGGLANSTNNFGSGGNNGSGTTLNNNIGAGSSVAGSTVNNNIGQTQSGGGVVNNSFGGGSGGSSTNSIGSVTDNGTSTNNFGTTGTNGNSGTATNNIGTGFGASANNFGNTNISTTNSINAGNSSSFMGNGVSTTSVQSGGGIGGSVLGGTTSANSGAVLNGAFGTFANVDSNGKITMQTDTATQSSTSMTITNGLGNTHGLVVNERQATISGGTTSSSMTLNDYGATFSNSANGRPIQVHGVADGTSRYDAVNVQQMDAVKQGIAGVAAMNNIPSLESGKQFNLGIGFGGFDRETSFAIGGNARVTDNFVIKASAGRGFGANDSNISTTTWGVGGALSW